MGNWIQRREVTLTIIIFLFIGLVSLRAPGFALPSNMYDVLNDTAVLMLAATAQFLVLLTGGIDLSIPSIMALTGMSLAMLNMKVPLLPIPVVVALAILVGLIQGGLNGLFVGVLRIPSIITTLGTMAMYRALVFLLSGGQWVSAHEMAESFKNIPHTPFLGISGILWYTAIVVCLVGIFLTYSRWGRFVYAVGGNRTAARLVGISGSKVDGLVFLLSGAISGLAGLLYVTRYAAAQTDSALGYELQAVAACVIGGVSVSGGSGTILGVVLGAFFLGLLYNALTVVNLSPFYQMALQGFAILVAIVANTVVNQKNQKTMVAKRKLI
ncbi:ABC transporter permease [Treponema sp. J25]|uniref:ABC transporter permease n=1 Tax=Treponema sp. J25 TaxID=2094121 RepID=UPI0010478CB2|nr:ABC transporter permease [Treponema sp. J25]TCW61118.1 branched-chain amino acid ABC transporter permease [Treponema sp. J25]